MRNSLSRKYTGTVQKYKEIYPLFPMKNIIYFHMCSLKQSKIKLTWIQFVRLDRLLVSETLGLCINSVSNENCCFYAQSRCSYALSLLFSDRQVQGGGTSDTRPLWFQHASAIVLYPCHYLNPAYMNKEEREQEGGGGGEKERERKTKTENNIKYIRN